ncbi:FMN-dependent NADH-azoreductase [Methylovirgula sp. 4M-Z18]|uniref:FMN-dependent NADH-azoreductase n=1 Tax=Methylovirgula sp. 4M-Z18 TaxID=2293567 RepID=UPI000E2F13AF|nr:FMN-dependent NADH-azoreductase [Methylovirgula sp. 4M-Z18]RFB79057.1 FMN-dependent NADH-azoreductase [Methylovirgula sp. 4M-Z18]
MKLLHIDSSILGEGSVSRLLTSEIVAAQKKQHPGVQVISRDLAAAPVGHLSGAHLAAAQGATPEAADLQKDVAAGQAALDEFLAADIVVIGAPMYNFGVPSQLKAWIDRIAVAGKTFRYTEKGPEGLAGDKKVIIASSRGGFYGADTPAAALDHQENYLRGLFGFLGVKDITFVRAEGIATGPDQRTKAIEEAKTYIAKIAA